MFEVMKEGGGARRAMEYGADYGDMTLRELIIRLFVEESETWDDLEHIEVCISGDLFGRLNISDGARKDAMDRLGYQDPVDTVTKVPLQHINFVLDLPGGAAAFTNTMKGASGCRFVVYTPKRVFGVMFAEFGRKVVSVPRHPER